jgi:hypothetical protein
MEVQIDARPVPCGQIEDDVEVPHRVAVHARGIDPADRLHAAAKRLLEQLGGAGIDQQPVLGKRDLLHLDAPAEPQRGGAHRLHAAKPDLGVDVGVAAHVRRAGGDHPLEQRRDAIDARDAELAAPPAVVRDPVRERVAGRVRHPRSSVQRLVEMAVRVDEPRQHQPTGHIEHLRLFDGDPRLDPLDHAVAHGHVRRSVLAPRPATAQQQIRHLHGNVA